MSILQMKMISSLEKCFWDEDVDSKAEKNSFIMFKNERLSFQIVYRYNDNTTEIQRGATVKVEGALADYTKVRIVQNVANLYPTYVQKPTGEFLRTEPGLYPDLLRPQVYPDAVPMPYGQTHAMWVDIELPEDFQGGEYEIRFKFISNARGHKGEFLDDICGTVRVLDAKLPKQTLIHTEWFYADCIADYYNCRIFSERHWRLIENYIKTAVKNGINMILTPVFTPELDTYVGGERPTTQLVDIELTDDGKYSFAFEKLHRWIDMCLKCGVEYFEIPHFFSQWGAKATPKIIIKVNGRKKKYFGWHTDSMGEDYADFLSQFIPALVAEFKGRGLDGKCYFHVSDEPSLANMDKYTSCKERIAKYLEGYPIIDALSNFEFYSTGVLENPVPGTRHAMPFVKANVPDLWVYYCGGGLGGVSDRSMSMPSQRTRILGVQLYYYNIKGFLHWGYNFYNCCKSYSKLDPYCDTAGHYFMPAGDAFLVYPGNDGQPWESLRLNAMREAMDDIRALQLYEEKFGREAAERLITEDMDGELTFTEYPTDKNYLINLREKIARSFI